MNAFLIDSPPDLLIIFLVVMLIFGGKKLPELARGSGRALRIFKSEVSGLEDDATDSDPASDTSVASSAASEAAGSPTTSLEARQAAERARLEARHAAERRAADSTD